MILLGKVESKSTEIFVKGAGHFMVLALIVELARGINITLEDGKIYDIIINF